VELPQNINDPSTTSLRTQTYFRLSLGSTKYNVCEPEPENDFCDVAAFAFSCANRIAL